MAVLHRNIIGSLRGYSNHSNPVQSINLSTYLYPHFVSLVYVTTKLGHRQGICIFLKGIRCILRNFCVLSLLSFEQRVVK
jgi:hypothetical protein